MEIEEARGEQRERKGKRLSMMSFGKLQTDESMRYHSQSPEAAR
jgi:hypothetical protein